MKQCGFHWNRAPITQFARSLFGNLVADSDQLFLPVEIRDLTTGLWIWRFENPFWKPGVDWEPLTTSTCVESEGEILVLDPQAPPAGAVEV